MNQTILDDVLQAFTRILTGGFLALHPSVMQWLAVLLTAMLVISLFLCSRFAHQPYVLIAMGGLWIRALVLVTVATNWLTITDWMLNGLAAIGLSVSRSELSPAEFLQPGRILFLGAMLSQNFVWLVAQLGEHWLAAPILFFWYMFGSVMLWFVFAVMAFLVMIAVIEFQLLSLYAFLAWPLMTVGFLSWIAGDLARFLIGSALRTSALAALLSVALPFAGDLSLGADAVATVQGAASFTFGIFILGGLIWFGPRAIGASSMPGRNLIQLGMLTWIGLRRSAA